MFRIELTTWGGHLTVFEKPSETTEDKKKAEKFVDHLRRDWGCPAVKMTLVETKVEEVK